MTSQQEDTHPVKLISFNCQGFKSSRLHVEDFCTEYDIIALQEHWLLPGDIDLLGQVHPDFDYHGLSAVDASEGTLKGRPYGGVAILWRRNMFPSVASIQCDSTRVVAVRISCGAGPATRAFIVMSIYMPCDVSENIPLFTECLGKISAVTSMSDVESVIALGDFNAKPGAPFYTELCSFCDEQDLVCADVDFLGESSNTYTFRSKINTSIVSWLDHCLTTMAARDIIINVRVLHDAFLSDHFPLIIDCDLNIIKPKSVYEKPVKINKAIWGKKDDTQTRMYTDLCTKYLQCTYWPRLPSSGGCDLDRNAIDMYYKNIINCMTKAAIDSYRGKSLVKKKHITGWNIHVRETQSEARTAYQTWLTVGCPNVGPYYDVMRQTKRCFKNKVKWCIKNQERIRMDIVATHRSNKDFKSFWQEVNKLNPKSSLTSSVNGSQDNFTIANMFVGQFKVPLPNSCNTCDGSAHGVPASASSAATLIQNNPSCITTQEIFKCIRSMQRGKSPGHDGLSIEHVLHGGPDLLDKIATLFNACIDQCYMPADFMKTIVVPIAKNRTGDLTSLNNYRPISLATILSKILERILYPQLSNNIRLNDAQFGFRSNSSTDFAIFTLKNSIKYYLDRNTTIYACFLDLSRAFDTINYNKLWEKLEQTNVPLKIAKLLQFWYANQTNQVRWHDKLSNSYRLDSGVRQGGLTSPLLFNLYVDGLIEELSSARVGCHIAGSCVNNISYADDMALLSPSIAGLSKLISICEMYAAKHDLVYNVKKTEVMVFKCKISKTDVKPLFCLGGSPLSVVNKFKYLGHILSDNLKDDEDLDRQRRAIAAKSNMLARRFSAASIDVKITLFKAYCQAFYTNHLWQKCNCNTLHHLRVQYNNAFRAMLRLPWRCSASGMFTDNRVDDFYAVMRRTRAGFHERLIASANKLVYHIFHTVYMHSDNFNMKKYLLGRSL